MASFTEKSHPKEMPNPRKGAPEARDTEVGNLVT
jgi:hypothetical protein